MSVSSIEYAFGWANYFHNGSSSREIASYHNQVGNAFGLLLEYCMLTLTFFVLCQYKWSDVSRKAKHLKSFPGPKPLPIIGNGHLMLFKPTEFYEWSWALCKKWGGETLTWRLNFPVLWISNSETAIELLKNPEFNAKSQDLDMFWRQRGGNGLSSSPAHVHTARRKLVYPGYMRQVINRSVYIFSEETKRLVEKLQPLADSGQVFEVLKWITPCSFRIICRSAFGDDLIAEQTDAEALCQMRALHKISVNFTARLMSPNLFLRNDFVYFNLTREGRKTWECIKVVNDFASNAIKKKQDERRKKLENNENVGKVNNETPSYLDMLLNLCDSGDLEEKFILGELNNYVVGGYDPTAITVAWTLFALALNDQCHQQKICDELDEIFGPVPVQNWDITAADTKKMKYLELCVKEALRLFPTAPLLPRSTPQDIKLKDGRVIPSGTDVFILVDMINRDPRYFQNPEQFLPERHLESNPAFIPFSTGVRWFQNKNLLSFLN